MNVYVIQAGNKKGPYKIGVADNPKQRMADLQIGNHVDLRLLLVIPCSSRRNAYHLETRLHRELGGLRIRGEWFNSKLKLKEVIERAEKKGFKPEKIDSPTENQKLINRLRERRLKHFEIIELYDLLKENMDESDFSPVDEILDERKKK